MVVVIFGGIWSGLEWHPRLNVCMACFFGQRQLACVAFPPVPWQPFRVTETQAWFLEGDGHALECKAPLAGFSLQVFELHEHCDGLFIISNIPYIAVKGKEKECRWYSFHVNNFVQVTSCFHMEKKRGPLYCNSKIKRLCTYKGLNIFCKTNAFVFLCCFKVYLFTYIN